VHADLPFDPARDLVPVASAASTSIAIAVSNDSGISSIQELATLARARPGGVLWTASAGLPEFLFRAWCAHERLNLRHVAYRDPSAALLDLGQGRVEVMVAALPTLAGAVDAQRARLIAVATPTRSPGAADVPTLAELGYDHLSVETPQGIFAARGTPGDLITRIAEAVGAAAEDIELTARLKRIGFRPAPSGPAEFARSVELQTARVRAIADAAKHLEGGSDVRVP
jgi:tripartite-type tricarboxylate transporter receptor subunit TctC